MTTKPIDGPAALVRVIQEVFHRSAPCHCHGDGKLSEQEVLSQLLQRGYVLYADANVPALLPIDTTVSYSLGSYDMRKIGVRYLSDLTAWTHADLLSMPSIGPVKAAKIEGIMARFGLFLKDGDPRRYQDLPETEPDPESRPMGGTPDEIRRACALDLMAVAQRMTQFAAGIMRYGVRASAPSRRALGGQLIRHARDGMQAHRDAMGIGKVLQDLEARERKEQRLPGPRGRTIVERGNVVSGAFPAGDREAQAAGGQREGGR